MESARVLNRPDDYEKMGINPNEVEPWEDGRRREAVPGAFENWYFDAILDDGAKVVVVFMPRSAEKRNTTEWDPNLRIEITTADGRDLSDEIFVPVEESETREGECHVQYGPHTYLGFPSGEVTGSLAYDGQTREVHGKGYHDHQFHNTDSMSTIHHWLWGRQTLKNHTVFIIDIVANAKYGFTKVPIFAVIDNATGEVIFENDDDSGFTMDIEETYLQAESKKDHPRLITYTYDHGDMKVIYRIRAKEEIEVRSSANIFMKTDEKVKERLAAAGLDPSYIRYQGEAELEITQGEQVTREKGDMIYEFARVAIHGPNGDDATGLAWQANHEHLYEEEQYQAMKEEGCKHTFALMVPGSAPTHLVWESVPGTYLEFEDYRLTRLA